MKQNLEIEFKTFITKDKYDELIKKFNLSEKIFLQINHYFDNSNLELNDNKIVLRIRQKQNNYKLTSKSKVVDGELETHISLSENEALDMLENGFDANIINLNYNVKKVGELATYRVTMPFNDGVVFFDKSVYGSNTDYEIEFEATSFQKGKEDFNLFLTNNNVEFVEATKKSSRIYKAIK